MGRSLCSICAVYNSLFCAFVRYHVLVLDDLSLRHEAVEDALEGGLRRTTAPGQAAVIALDRAVGLIDQAEQSDVDTTLRR